MAVLIIRTVIMYLAIAGLMRIMGKRQLGDLEPAELVVAVLISDIAAQPLQDTDIPMLYGLVPVLVLVCCEILTSAAMMISPKVRTLISGEPSLVIENGRLCEKELRKNRLTIDEITEGLRKNGILDMQTVKYAVLETDGTLSTILYPAAAPVTADTLNIDGGEVDHPVAVISDGRVLHDNLKALGYDEKWLLKRLHEQKTRSIKDVYYMTVKDGGEVFIQRKER